MASTLRPTIGMRNLGASLQEFGEFLLKAKLVREKSAPHVVRWVRRFLSAPASHGALADQARQFRVETTMISTHVVKDLRNPARSPADLLQDRAGK
jgi:hypothetical protein